MAFNSVNPHCLEHIIGLSEKHEVVVQEDIHDLTGTKLLASGYTVSRSMQEKLSRRRLARPLEASLSVAGGTSLEVIAADALLLLEQNEIMAAIAGSSGARALIRSLQNLPLPGPVKLLLTSAREGTSNYPHTIATIVVCAGLAVRLGLNDRDGSHLLLAALVHDIGELYVHPDYLNGSKLLSPAEWKHVATHPVVGHAFIGEFTSYPAVIAECVLHHHERLDGSGYPFQVQGSAVNRLAAILGVADSVSAIAIRRNIGLRERLLVALRIIPEEFDRATVAAINSALAALPPTEPSASPANCSELIQLVLARLDNAGQVALALSKGASSSSIQSARNHAISVLANIQKSLRATGVSDPTQIAMILDDPLIAHETLLVTNEISWRLRSLARNIHLRVERTKNLAELNAVAGLINALDPTAPPPV